MNLMNRLRKSLLASLTVAGLTYALCVPSALPNPWSTKSLTESLEEIEAVDGQGLWFSYGIALLGGMFGLGLGGWALYEVLSPQMGTLIHWSLILDL